MAKATKGGRPPKGFNEKLSRAVTVKFTMATFTKVEQRAKQAGITVAEYLRNAALSARITARLSEHEMTAVRSLTGMANNLNQLTKMSHQQGLQAIAKELRWLVSTIRDIITSCK